MRARAFFPVGGGGRLLGGAGQVGQQAVGVFGRAEALEGEGQIGAAIEGQARFAHGQRAGAGQVRVAGGSQHVERVGAGVEARVGTAGVRGGALSQPSR